MKLLARSLLATLACAAATAQADLAVYRNQQLEVPRLVVMNNTGPVYYSDLRFRANPDGSYTLVRALRHPLAEVDSVEVTVDQTEPAQAEVAISGSLSVACEALEEPVVMRKGNIIRIVLPETLPEPDEVCMSLVAVTPFDITVPLDLSGLKAGTYRVIANGRFTRFRLDADQP